MAFISDDPVIQEEAPAAEPSTSAAPAPTTFVTKDKPLDEVQELAKDDAFDPVDYHLQNGESDESLTKAAQVMEARHKLPKKPALTRAAEFGGGVFEEVGNLGQDIWHALPGTGHWDGEAKSSVGTFLQGLGSAGTNAVLSIADEPGFDPEKAEKGEAQVPWAPQALEGQDTWLQRLETRKHNYEVAVKNEEPERQKWLQEHGTIRGFVSKIPADDVVGPQERAAFDTVAARSAQNAASLRLGALHGGETAMKAYRYLKGGEDKFSVDDWRVRLAEDASMRKAANELKQGKMDNSDERGGIFAGGPDITPETQKRLFEEGQINPDTIEKQAVVGDPTNIALMEALRLPVVNKSIGATMKLSGRAMEAVGGAVDKLIGKTGGKVLLGAGAAGGTYLVGEHLLHGDVKPLGAALALFAARFALTRAGRLIGESGSELMNPEAFNSRAALSAAEAGQATAAAGGKELTAAQQAMRNFTSAPDNVAAASRIARRTVQGVGIGAAGAVPFAALADNPEQAGKAIGGGIAFGATLGPLGGSTENPGLNRAMEINKAATRLLADKGAGLKFSDPNLQRQHDTATEDLSYTVKTYVNALKGLFSGFKGRNGQNMNIAILEPADFAAQVKERAGGPLDESKLIDAHGFFDADSGTVFINKGNLRVDAAGHEGGHFLSNDVMRQMGKAYGSAMRSALEEGLFTGGRPTPEFQKFIDSYNAATPGNPIPYLRGKGPILQHRAVGEYVAETTRAILGEPNVGRFTLPKDVSDRMADKLVAMYGNATAEKGQDLFDRTDLPTVNKAVKDVIFDLGRGMKPEPTTASARRSSGEPVTAPDGSAPTDVSGTPNPIAPTGGLTPTAPEKKEEPFSDVGLSQDVVDEAEGNHVNWPQPPETIRANAKRRIKGRSRDQVAEERLADWHGMFQKYVEYLRANGLQAPNEARQLALDVAQFALRSDAGASPAFAEAAGAPAESSTSMQTKSEPAAALAEPTAPAEGRGALSEPEPAPAGTGERPPALQDAPEAPAVTSEADASQRATNAENTAVQSPEFKRKRNDVTRAEHRRNARVSALLEVAGEDAANMGDGSMLQRRTDEDGKERFTGKIDPENIASHRLLLRELGVQPDGDAVISLLSDKVGQTVYLDYQSAPKEKGQEGDISSKQRAGELRKSTAEDRRTGGDHTLQEGKAFHVLGFKVFPGKGSVTLFGFSPDKWISNAGKLMTHLDEQGVHHGYDGVNDPQMLADMDGYSRNHKNGYKGDGSAPVAGVEPTGEPYLIPKDKFDLLNASLNFDISTKGESKREDTQRGALEAQERATANDVALDPETGDASPLRAYVNKSGKLITPSPKGDRVGTGPNLESVYENIAPDLVQGLSEEPAGQNLIRPTGFKGNPGEATRSGIPNSDYAASGFMPDSGEFYRGTTPGDTRRIDEPFTAAKGKTFVARTPEGAGQYGSSIEKFTPKENAKVLRDDSSEFWRVIGRRKPPNGYIGSSGRKGESMVDVVNDAIRKAEAAGYDAISIGDADIGTVILNENAFNREPHSSSAFMPAPGKGALEESGTSIETKSPEFKRFFEGSKVTDKNGEPKKVYHSGTFDVNEQGVFHAGDDAHLGIHFGTKEAAQERVSGKQIDDLTNSIETYEIDGQWHYELDGQEGYYEHDGFPTKEAADDAARIEALHMGDNMDFTGMEEVPITEAYLSLKNPIRMPDLGTWPVDLTTQELVKKGIITKEEAAGVTKSPELVKLLKEKGYDGVVYKNEFEHKGSDSYIAFDSNQIKSATHNSGEFDPSNPDIRFMPDSGKKGALEDTGDIDALRAKVKDLHDKVTDEATYETYSTARQELGRAEFTERNGAPPASMGEIDKVLEPLSRLQTKWKRGPKIEDSDTFGVKYEADGSGHLFRSVTKSDWARIKEQGYIDTDGRSAIDPTAEGINMGEEPQTAAGYIPLGGKGVVLAIKTQGLKGLFKSKVDDYVRTTERIPIENIVDHSPLIGRDKEMGQYYLPDEPSFMPDSGEAKGEDSTSIKTKSEEKFPRIKKGEKVSGLTVRSKVPNQSSIEASLENPKILPGIRELRVSDFTDGNSSMMRSKDTVERVDKLANEIKESGEINPLIVAVEPGQEPYILEGAHRIEALAKNGVETFPAMVAVDTIEHGVSLSPYTDMGKPGAKPYFVHRIGDTNTRLSHHATPAEAWDAAEALNKKSGEFMPDTGEAKPVQDDSANAEAARKKTMDARRKADFMNQMKWLEEKAKEEGHAGLDDMNEKDGAGAAKLMKEWRGRNPRFTEDGEQLFMPLSKRQVEAGGYNWGQSEVRDAMGDKLVKVNVPEFDKAWQKDGKDFYIPPEGGGGEIKGRKDRFKDWREEGRTIEAPFVYVGENGAVSFIDGRHRFSTFRDEGATELPVSMDKESLKRARKLGIVEPPAPKTKGEFMPKSKGGALEDSTSIETKKVDVAKLKTGEPVTLPFLRRTKSATELLGLPNEDSPFDRGYEPSGKYVMHSEGEQTPYTKESLAAGTMEAGETTLENPIVLEHGNYGSPSSWKRVLSDMYEGKTGKALSKAIIEDGHDGVIAVESKAGRESHIAEAVDLTSFDEGKAKFMPESGQKGALEDGEQDKTLIAVHNVSADKLTKAIELGGLAVPSIAIAKRGDAPTGFGEISLVGDRNLVDPERDSTNRVFGADIYSKRQPQPEYKVDGPAVKKLVKEFTGSRPDWYRVTEDSPHEIPGWARKGTPGNREQMLQKARYSNLFRQKFVEDQTGQKYNAKEVPAPVNGLADTKAFRNFAETGGVDFDLFRAEKGDPKLEPFKEAIIDGWKEYIEGKSEQIRRTLGERTYLVHGGGSDWAVYSRKEGGQPLEEGFKTKEDAIKRADEMSKEDSYPREYFDDDGEILPGRAQRLLDDAAKIKHKRTVFDNKEVRQTVDDYVRAHESEFNQWVEDKIDPLFSEPRVKDGKTKYNYTLDNIVDAMTGGPVRGRENNLLAQGLGLSRARSAREFKSVAEMHEAEANIVSDKEFQSKKEEVDKAFFKATQNLGTDAGGFDSLDNASKAIGDYLMGTQTFDNMRRSLMRNRFKDPDAEAVKAMMDVAKALKAMPTEYFEAKLRRAVKIPDFAGAAVPKSAPEHVKDALRKAGLDVVEYDSNDPQSRQDAVEQITARNKTAFMADSGQPKAALEGEGDPGPTPMRPRAAAALQDDDE